MNKKKKRRTGFFPIFLLALIFVAAAALLLPFGLLSTPISRRDTVMTAGGYGVPADEFVYTALAEITEREKEDPDYYKDGAHRAELLENTKSTFVSRYALRHWAADEGLEDEKLKAGVETYIADVKSTFPSEAEFMAELKAQGITEELYEQFLYTEFLLSRLQQYVYSESELSVVSDGEYEEYMSERRALGYRLIFISEGGDSERKTALAEDIAAALRENPALFDEKQALYNEDPLAASFCKGYTKAEAELTPAIADALKPLAVGETAGPVKVTGGYCVLLRTEPDKTVFYYQIVGSKVEAKVREYEQSTVAEVARGFNSITVEEIKAFAAGEPMPSPFTRIVTGIDGIINRVKGIVE